MNLTADGLRLTNKGLFGTIAVVALVALIIRYAPELIAFVWLRRLGRP